MEATRLGLPCSYMENRVRTQRANAYLPAMLSHVKPCTNKAASLTIEIDSAMFTHGKPCKNTAGKRVFGCHGVHGVTV